MQGFKLIYINKGTLAVNLIHDTVTLIREMVVMLINDSKEPTETSLTVAVGNASKPLLYVYTSVTPTTSYTSRRKHKIKR